MKYYMAKKPDELKGEVVHKEIMHYLADGVSYIDALVQYCNDNGLEVEVIAAIVRKSPILKGKVQEDAEKFNMLITEK